MRWSYRTPRRTTAAPPANASLPCDVNSVAHRFLLIGAAGAPNTAYVTAVLDGRWAQCTMALPGMPCNTHFHVGRALSSERGNCSGVTRRCCRGSWYSLASRCGRRRSRCSAQACTGRALTQVGAAVDGEASGAVDLLPRAVIDTDARCATRPLHAAWAAGRHRCLAGRRCRTWGRSPLVSLPSPCQARAGPS